MEVLLEKNKNDHYNLVEDIYTKVSTGSLFLDAEIKITEGVHRFCGPAGAGKTSQAAMIAKNFLDSEKRGKVLWVKAEGRLSEAIQLRSGVKFVKSAEAWDYGTAFLLESNTFEFICEVITSFVKQFRENGDKLCVIIDSVDGLKLKSDANNALGKERTAGPQLIMKRFLKDMYYPIVKNGVVCIAVSQVTSTIAKDDYAPPALVSGGGGNALLHWSNYILEFSGRYWGDNILQDGPNTKHDPEKNPIVGHWASITIKKSDRENENKRVKYPIRHGRIDGTSIWTELEVITFAQQWELIETKGAWFTFPKSTADEILKDTKIEVKEKIQGEKNMLDYLEQNPKIAKHLFDRIKRVQGK
jgi:RecA/RadA recombinase